MGHRDVYRTYTVLSRTTFYCGDNNDVTSITLYIFFLTTTIYTSARVNSRPHETDTTICLRPPPRQTVPRCYLALSPARRIVLRAQSIAAAAAGFRIIKDFRLRKWYITFFAWKLRRRVNGFLLEHSLSRLRLTPVHTGQVARSRYVSFLYAHCGAVQNLRRLTGTHALCVRTLRVYGMRVSNVTSGEIHFSKSIYDTGDVVRVCRRVFRIRRIWSAV